MTDTSVRLVAPDRLWAVVHDQQNDLFYYSAGTSVYSFDPKTGESDFMFNGALGTIDTLALSADGTSLLVGFQENSQVLHVPLATFDDRTTFVNWTVQSGNGDIVVAADGRIVVAGGTFSIDSPKGNVTPSNLPDASGFAFRVSSDHNRYILMGDTNTSSGTLLVYDTQTNTVTGQAFVQYPSRQGADISEEAGLIVTGTKVYDFNLSLVAQIPVGDYGLNVAKFYDDGHDLITYDSRGNGVVYDTATWAQIGTIDFKGLEAGESYYFNNMAFSDDGKYLFLTGDYASGSSAASWGTWSIDLSARLHISATGTSHADTLHGSIGGDTLSGGKGDDLLIDKGGDDILNGGDGSDTLSYAPASAGVTVSLLNAGVAQDTIGAGVDTLISIENLIGTAFADSLTGDAGANRLDGGAGADTLTGGLGDDTYVVDNAADLTVEKSGEGTDTIQSTLTWTLGANVENLVLLGTANLNGTGNSDANLVTGNAGDNILDGGVGADTLVGGLGNDIYVVDNAGDVVVEKAGEGTDTVQSQVSWTLAANIENLTLTGTASINATGNDGANTIIGNSGNNILTGGDGLDTFVISRGGGQDVINDFAADEVIDLSQGAGYAGYIGLQQVGDDTLVVLSLNDSILLKNVLATSLTAANFIFAAGASPIVGTDGHDVLTGTAGDDILNGKGGADTLNGLAGKDILFGGTGADTMAGGTDNDTYYVDNSGDKVIELAGEGIDTVVSSRQYVLGDNVERLTLTGTTNISGTGNALNNILIGNDGDNHLSGLAGNDTLSGGLGNDVLDGGKGADAMKGGAGDDRYYVENTGDVVSEFSNSGHDTVVTTLNYALGANVEDLIQVGTHDYYASGNALDNHLTGNSGNNLFHGNDGNDVIDGGKGADKMYGGLGDDTFYVDNIGDVVVEYTGQGTDSVFSSISYALGGAVENLTLTGTTNINGTGTNGDNILVGNAGDNILTGGKGHDTLTGGAGADTFVFGLASGADTITDFSASQNDKIDLSAWHAQSTAVILQVGSDTTIDLGGGNIITLTGVTATDSAFLSHITW